MAKCILCKTSDINDIKYGKLITKKDISVHYFCLLLTSNLVQHGDDHQGVFGFLLIDIQKEAKRISKQICCYCGLSSAGIGCCDLKCRRIFHLICGIENGALNQFTNTYRSFCNFHIPRRLREKSPPNSICSICYDQIDDICRYTMVCKAPCCKNGWFHKYCLQEFANSSGYFFKCPLCNNKDHFREILTLKGIFVPDQDAAWELEPNAFAELHERPTECIALKCLCFRGRKYDNSNEYELIFCITCGSKAIHVSCNGNNGNEFNCDECSKFLNRNENLKCQYNNNSSIILVRNDNNTSNNRNSVTNNNSIILARNDKNTSVKAEDSDASLFINVDDIEDENNEITAAQAFRFSINNHPLSKNDSKDFENVLNNNTTITKSENLDELFRKDNEKTPNIHQQTQRRIRYISDSENDDIQLTRSKKRKIISDLENQNKSINRIITRSRSISQSSDDIHLIMNDIKNKHRNRNSQLYANTTDSSQNSPILRNGYVTKKNLKNAIISSEDNLPLTVIANRVSIENNTILKKPSDEIETELNIGSNESNSNNTSCRNSRSRIRKSDDKIPNEKKYYTRSKSQTPKLCSCEISKTATLNTESFSHSKVDLECYQRENSESSLSSADMEFKKKIKTVLEDNMKKKQTPINRNIPSSTARLKSRFIKLKSKKESCSSASSSSLLLGIAKNSSVNSPIKTRQVRKRLRSPTSELSLSNGNIIENDKIRPRNSKTKAKECIKQQCLISNEFNKTKFITSSSSSSESNSDCSSSSLRSQATKSKQLQLCYDTGSDTDDFVTTVIKNINNKENKQCKNIFNERSKNSLNTNNKTDDKLKKTVETRHYLEVEIISITIREERQNKRKKEKNCVIK